MYIDLGGSHAGRGGADEEPANQMVSQLHTTQDTMDAKLQYSTVELLQVNRVELWVGLTSYIAGFSANQINQKACNIH